MQFPQPPEWASAKLKEGAVIPAHPLALDAQGRFDQRRQRALTRYYAAAGAGGVAVGVHTTQFAIRDPKINLLEPVLKCAGEALDEIDRGGNRLIRIAGICGPTPQAMAEARLAAELGYHVGLLSLAALKQASDDELIRHCEAVAGQIPLMGFYLQRAVGGRRLGFDFWRRFAGIPNVVAIKMAPFNRYETLDVIRGVAEAGSAGRVALYTGNDDNIVPDLLTPYALGWHGSTARLSSPKSELAEVGHASAVPPVQIVGGLLGHWAVWTSKAVELHRRCRQVAAVGGAIPAELLAVGAQVTDMNAALFDVANDFAGCIAGIQFVLHRQGLLASPRCLEEREVLSPGQAEQIQRVERAYPHLVDDDFVKRNLAAWLA
jgi:dihydrodipicolinate synthase/N-acetylneuraminate lyase